jgi:hypothetical protein
MSDSNTAAAAPAQTATPAQAPAPAFTPQPVGTSSGPAKYLKARIGGNRHGIELESVLPRAIWGWQLVPFMTGDGRQGLACIACATPDVPPDIQQQAIANSFATIFPVPEHQGVDRPPLGRTFGQAGS